MEISAFSSLIWETQKTSTRTSPPGPPIGTVPSLWAELNLPPQAGSPSNPYLEHRSAYLLSHAIRRDRSQQGCNGARVDFGAPDPGSEARL